MTPNANIGDPPTIDWVDVTMLEVDPLYQRPEDEKRVAKIVSEFRWDRFGALVLAPKQAGRFAIIDGQHRARAAQLHPEVELVPAVIITAPTVSDEARSFVGINAERKNTSSLELFFAQLAAGDEDAETIRQACERAGVRIPKYASSGFKPRETIAIAAIHAVIGRHGAQRAREYLEVLAAAEFAPIKADQVKAVEHLMHDPEFRGQVVLDDLRAAIQAVGLTGDVEAKRFAATHCVPVWRGLANVWFQKCRKQRRPPPSPVVLPRATVSSPARVAPAPVAPRACDIPAKATRFAPGPKPAARVVTGSVLGDPPAGRSALDQRGQGR